MLKRPRAISPPPSNYKKSTYDSPADEELPRAKRVRFAAPETWDTIDVTGSYGHDPTTRRNAPTSGYADEFGEVGDEFVGDEGDADVDDGEDDAPPTKYIHPRRSISPPPPSFVEPSAYTSINSLLHDLNRTRAFNQCSIRNNPPESDRLRYQTRFEDHFDSLSLEGRHPSGAPIRDDRRSGGSAPAHPLRNVVRGKDILNRLSDTRPASGAPSSLSLGTISNDNNGIMSHPGLVALGRSKAARALATVHSPLVSSPLRNNLTEESRAHATEEEAVRARYEETNRLLGMLVLSRRRPGQMGDEEE
ncbi:hypothetical protein FRB99_002480 [Tulasnella sp. 403]|nr:hypothetical protein FRB99_002480 [Tulasnella sp. 403]